MEVFPLSPEEKKPILAVLESDEFQQNIRILEEWYKTQPHFPQNIQVDYILRRILSGSKASVERAKKKVDSHFTMKNLNKNDFKLFSRETSILPSKCMMTFLMMPKLGPDGERIWIIDVKKPSADDFEFNHLIQVALMIQEFSLRYDLCHKVRVIANATNFNMDYIEKFDLAWYHRHSLLTFEGYSYKFISIDIVHASTALQFFLNVLKKIIRAKFFQRIIVHNDFESLYRSIGKEYLPEEFGGTQDSLESINETLDKVLEREREYLINCGNCISDEDKRISSIKTNEMFGVDGTFKKLFLD